MNGKLRVGLMWGGLALVGSVFTGLVLQKEAIVHDGQRVLLRLGPTDPRSLMQGDYMTLRYGMTWWNRAVNDLPPDGKLVLRKGAEDVGELVGLYDPSKPLAPGELTLRYRRRGWETRIGAEAYYFQEGQGDRFAKARFGELRVAPSGEAVLVGLCDDAKQPIMP